MCERDEQVCMRARRARRAAGRGGCDVFEALTRDVIAIARGVVGGVIGAEAHEGWVWLPESQSARQSAHWCPVILNALHRQFVVPPRRSRRAHVVMRVLKRGRRVGGVATVATFTGGRAGGVSS